MKSLNFSRRNNKKRRMSGLIVLVVIVAIVAILACKGQSMCNSVRGELFVKD